MHVGIVSDTHDNVPAVEAIVEDFEERDVEVVLHAGDVVAPLVVPFFEGFEVHAVLGNNDGEVAGLTAAFEELGEGSALHGRFADLRIDGVDVAMLHGESLEEVQALAASGAYDLVVSGHYHERVERQVGETTVCNPGAHFPTVDEADRTVAILETETGDLAFERIGPTT